jgi:hypothetical protein
VGPGVQDVIAGAPTARADELYAGLGRNEAPDSFLPDALTRKARSSCSGFFAAGCFTMLRLSTIVVFRDVHRTRMAIQERLAVHSGEVVVQTVLNASVGERRAARIAGRSPAPAPMRMAAPSPPAQAVVGMTVVQCLPCA